MATRQRQVGRRNGERGFSYIDIMIAMTILLIGILTLGAALTAALVRTTAGESQLRAKAIAAAALENVLSARYVKLGGNAYTFDAIQSVGSGPGVFLTGKRPIKELPGPDGLLGTADDTGAVLEGYERQIVIVDVPNPRRPSPPNPVSERRITVTIYYQERGIERQESLTTSVCLY
jgi:hypothetical protein